MAYFELPFSIKIANALPVDGDRYIAADITARNAIQPSGRAYVGMQVYVVSENKLYVLNALPGTWEELTQGSGISTAISTEVSNRSSADSSLSIILSNEVSTRSSADSTLSTALSSEVGTRSGADSTLSTAISTEVSTRSATISSEIATRSGADSTLSAAISTEASTRAASDSTFLVKSNNLSDLTNVGSARTTLLINNVDNTADSSKSVSYAVNAGSAVSAGSAGTTNYASDSGLLNGSPGSYYAQPLATHTYYADGFFNNGFYVSNSTEAYYYNFTPEYPAVDYVIMGKTVLLNFFCEWTMPNTSWWNPLGRRLIIDFVNAGNIQFGSVTWFNVTIIDKDSAGPYSVRVREAHGQVSTPSSRLIIEYESISSSPTYPTFVKNNGYDLYFNGAFALA